MGYTPHVLVVGGGATGTSLLRDLALRGLEVTLVDRGPLASGATGRTGGLLHSGARYALSDPEIAARIHAENRRLRAVADHCIEETGGLLAQLPGDERAHLERTLAACETADIDVEELDAAEIQRLEPRLSSEVERGLFVPDASVDPFGLTVANARSALEFGATVETHAEVTDLLVEDGAVRGVELSRDDDPGTETVRADYVVNAAGAWAGEIAAMADITVPVERSREPRVVVDDQPTEAAVTRWRPGSKEVVVPYARRCVLGTTDPGVDAGGPSHAVADGNGARHPVERLVDDLSALVGDLPECRQLRAFPGLRASYRLPDGDATAGEDRSTVGTITLLDHAERDDTWGLSTVVGGTVTTSRLDAERVADHVCGKFGIDRACLTAERPLPGSDGDTDTGSGVDPRLDPQVVGLSADRLGSRTREVLADEDPNPVVCACESVTRAEVTDALEDDTGDRTDLESVRVRTRAGMGTCQGGRCCHRLAAQLYPAETATTVDEVLESFHRRRWAGQRPALWGDQLAEAMETYALHATTMNRDGTVPSATGGLMESASPEPTDPDAVGGQLDLGDFDSGPEWDDAGGDR